MANYTDKSEWVESIYTVRVNTPVLGGEVVWQGTEPTSGYANASATQLADRTRWLKEFSESLDWKIDDRTDGVMKGGNNLSELTDVQEAKYRLDLNLVDNVRDLDKPISTYQQEALDNKQNSLTAGDNVTIDGDVISSVDTKYSAGGGLTLLEGEFSVPLEVVGSGDFVSNLAQTEGGFSVTLANVDTVSYDTITVSEMLAGTEEYPRTITSKDINDFSNFSPITGDNISIDFNVGRNFSINLVENITLENPVNMRNGQTGDIVISVDGTEHTLSFGSVWKFAGGDVPETKANSITVISYKVVDASTIICGVGTEVK